MDKLAKIDLGRIHRSSDLPGNDAERVASIKRGGKSFNLPTLSGDSVPIFYRVGRWARIPDFRPVFRDIIGLAADWKRPNAFIHLIEWRLPLLLTKHQFFVGMDSHEDMSAELAGVLLAHWQIEELADAGTIMEFRKAWSRPGGEHLLPWRMANYLIDLCQPDASMMILKAYPLEYENETPAGSLAQGALKNRQLAMQKHYARQLGVVPFAGEYGDDGWMWKRFDDILSDPHPQEPLE